MSPLSYSKSNAPNKSKKSTQTSSSVIYFDLHIKNESTFFFVATVVCSTFHFH